MLCDSWCSSLIRILHVPGVCVYHWVVASYVFFTVVASGQLSDLILYCCLLKDPSLSRLQCFQDLWLLVCLWLWSVDWQHTSPQLLEVCEVVHQVKSCMKDLKN